MIKNIFQRPVGSHREVVYEMQDFCFENAMLEISYVMEDMYFDVNSNQLGATITGLKADSVEILEEGFNDFIDGAVKFFKKLIEKFKEFMKKAFMYINAYIGDFNKFVKRYSKELMKKYPDFTIEGYEYTIDNTLPDTSVIQSMLSDYNSELSSIDNMKKADIVKKRSEVMSEASMNKLRAKVLSKTTPIAKDDYVDECKKTFRNGDNNTSTIQINHDKLVDIVNGFDALTKTYKDAKKDQDKLIALLEDIKSFFQKSASLQYREGKRVIKTDKVSVNGSNNGLSRDGDQTTEYNTDKMMVYNTFFNFKFAYAKEVSAICVNAMSERVNALKEQLAQEKKIVRRCLGASKFEEDGGDN